MVESVKRTMWRCKDGELFELKRDAQKHEAKRELGEWADRSGICRGGEWGSDMILSQVLEDAHVLHRVLGEYIGAPCSKGE